MKGKTRFKHQEKCDCPFIYLAAGNKYMFSFKFLGKAKFKQILIQNSIEKIDCMGRYLHHFNSY